MKIIIAGGGTAGHVTPLLAVASEFKNRYPESNIRYIGQFHDPMRSYLISNRQDINHQYSILAGKWRRYHGIGFVGHLKDIKTILFNMRDAVFFGIGFIQSLIILIFWRPKVVFAKGGFVCLPVGLAAAFLRIPFVTHDSDVVPGLTNRILSRYAKLMAVGLPVELYKGYYPLKQLRYTGIPLRPEFNNISSNDKSAAQKRLNLVSGKVLLIIGGSLGAIRLNEAVLACLPQLLSDKNLHIIWLSGHNQFIDLSDRISKLSIDTANLKLLASTNDLANYISAADIVVSRAGATSIAELAAAAKPVILVPNPILVGGHQTKNADVLAKQNAVLVINEYQLKQDPQSLLRVINKLQSDTSLQANLSNNLHALAVPNAAKNIVDVIGEVIN